MKANVLPVLLAADRAGDPGTALRLYRQVLGADPGNAHASRELGRLLAESGELKEAVAVLREAARHHPGDARLLARLGRCTYLGGGRVAAGELLERALSVNPALREARLWLAEQRLAGMRAQEALDVLAPILKAPDADVHVMAARAFMATGRFDPGIEHLRSALALRPSPAIHCDLGWALKRVGLLDEALGEFDSALAAAPMSASALAGKAEILQSKGDTAGARTLIRQALDAGEVSPELALVNARLSKSKDRLPAAIEVLERSLARTGPDTELLLALGTLKDTGGDYDGAFECFRRSNELLRHSFDLGAHQCEVKATMEVFSREGLASMARASNNDPRPIFIVGMPRSGTSLVEQILASHPGVHGAGELEDINRMVVEMPGLLGLPAGGKFPHCLRGLSISQLDRLASVYLDRLTQLGQGARRVTDKMPQNYRYLGLIDVLFPGARVIHCVRHPLDTCLSCYTTGLSAQHSYRLRFADLAGVYRAYYGLMEHWRAVLRIPMIDAVYEDLVTDPGPGVRRLLEFAGLEWDERCLRPHENKRVVNTASIDQVKRPIYDSSINRWRRYEAHLGGLIAALGDLVPATPGPAPGPSP